MEKVFRPERQVTIALAREKATPRSIVAIWPDCREVSFSCTRSRQKFRQNGGMSGSARIQLQK
jgi:hypothetical protein